MNVPINSNLFFEKVNIMIDKKQYKLAKNYLIDIKNKLVNSIDISLACLNSGFLNYKLGDYDSAIKEFTEAI